MKKKEYVLDGKNILEYEYVKGQKYIGEHKDGIKHGHGTMYFINGTKYIGEYMNDLKHGQGTFILTNGQQYVGEWKDGRQSGKGTWTWPDGRKYVGEWKNGKMFNGTAYRSNGEITGICNDRIWNWQ
tara:strand:+ start:223 stop:603 length:381 start_codon:yes stop_codon:yes gene_type:complete